MAFSFRPGHGHIVVPAILGGPKAVAHPRLVLDTGATDTVINPSLLVGVGHDPAAATQFSRVMTGSGWVQAPVVPVRQLTALGKTVTGLPVLAFALPKAGQLDGVLGLDFLLGSKLEIDFRNGTIDLS